ncbi:Ig-like domain-containing protein [uncultured Methanobrevibacter sp.]|uniref:Ig-like domain-containing protein n=1 Tax=uncultured Methanobrevibacter sp. TaxID=253161 RepID=UPI0025EFF75D|nr:Ig-like domain-containing protein [uncultured Methanobrevibacter sp.]
MIKKVALILTLILVGLLALSAANAADNQTDDFVNTVINDENLNDLNVISDENLDLDLAKNEIILNNDSSDNGDVDFNGLSSSYDDQLCSTDLIYTHFDVPSSFNKIITINLKDSSNNLVKNAEVFYSFDYSTVQKTFSGNSISIPNSLESNATHALSLWYSTDGIYGTCIDTVYFFKPTVGECTLTNKGPSRSLFSITTYDGEVYGSIKVKLIDGLDREIKDIFNYYIDGDVDNQFNATNGNIVLNFTHNSYHDIVFVYKGKSSVYVPCNKTIRVCYKSSMVIKENEKYYVDGGVRILCEFFTGKSWVSNNYFFAPFGTNLIKIKNPFTGEVLEKEIVVLKRIIEAEDLITDYKNLTEYNVRVADENNKFTANLTVSFVLDNRRYDVVSDKEGYAGFKTHLKVGNYTITTRYCGIVTTNRIIVNPVYVDNEYKDMHIDSVTTYYGENKFINYGWKGYFKGFLKIYKGSVLIKTIDLDSSGYVDTENTFNKYSNNISTMTFGVGYYIFKIVDKNGKILRESYLDIQKIPTKIQVNTIKTTTKITIYHLKIMIKDKMNNKVKNGYLKCKINGKTYKTKVNRGFATLKINIPSKIRTYSCTVSFLENSVYKSSSAKFNLIVKKYYSKTTVNSVTIAPESKYTLKVNVKCSNGKKIKSGTVKVQINGKTYSAKVNNGVAKVKIKAPTNAGTYKATVNYGGNKQVHASSTTVNIHVKKIKYEEKVSSFTLVVPFELNEHVIRSYGVYSVETYKWVDSDVHVRIYIYKNNIRLTDIRAEAYIHFSSGEGIWVYTNDGIYNTQKTVINNDLAIKADQATVTVWI